MKCEVMINARSTLIQSRLTTRHLALVHKIYTKPVHERLMGELIFDFTMTLPLQLIASKKRKRKSSSHETAGNWSRDISKMFSDVNKKRKSKETVLLLSNLLAIESKKMKETIEAFLKNFHRTKLFLHFSLCSLFIFNFSNFEKTFAILKKFIFCENNFREFLV